MAALSISDLSIDLEHSSSSRAPYDEYASSNLAAADHAANMLVKAFENFVIPIIRAQTPASCTGSCVDDANRFCHLGPAAEQLLGSLKTFVTALIRSESDVMVRTDIGLEARDAVEVSAPRRTVELLKDPQTIEVSKQSHTPNPENEPLLKLVLEEAHHYIYNQMPIRLLTFKSDGSRIELVERSTIWHRISTLMEIELDDSTVEAEIVNLANSMIEGENREMSEAQKQKAGIECLVSKYTSFAVLSHTWLHDIPGEVTYTDWQSGKVDIRSRGYRKLANFCRVAAMEHNVSFGWMDTVCINKESSAELDESIRLMYRWYLHSYCCITYLAGTSSLQHMRHDSWFTRGWTLQELLAPHSIKFYNEDWQEIVPGLEDDKENPLILEEIRAATTITPDELKDDIGTIPISRRMQWAAKRRVTREEDTAYSLMGIFGVSISTAYGEGSERAFVRLVKEILSTGTESVLDILNWGCGEEYRDHRTLERTSVLIPSSPREYLWRADGDIHWYYPTIPITLTHLGLHVPVLLMLGASVDQSTSDEFRPIGNYYATAKDVEILSFLSSSCHDYHLLEMNPKRQNLSHIQEFAFFGVLNLLETANSIELPAQGGCFAVLLGIDPPPTEVGVLPREFIAGPILTKVATVFDLKRFDTDSSIIPKNELQSHGMTLRTLYL